MDSVTEVVGSGEGVCASVALGVNGGVGDRVMFTEGLWLI